MFCASGGDAGEDLREHVPRDRNLRHLQRESPSMTHEPGSSSHVDRTHPGQQAPLPGTSVRPWRASGRFCRATERSGWVAGISPCWVASLLRCISREV